MSAPGLPEAWRGKTAYQLIGRENLVRRINEAFPELASLPDSIPAFNNQYLAQNHPAALAIADDMGIALGCLLLTLKIGKQPNRAVRPEWDDSYWTHWGSIKRVIFGGGLMAGLLGKLMLTKAADMLDGLISLSIADYPTSLPLIGAARLAVDTHNSVWVFDFGGTNVKRGHPLYARDVLTHLEQLPSLSVPPFDQAAAVFAFMAQTIAASISSQEQLPQPQKLYISVANYAQGCHFAADNPYGRLNSLSANLCDLLSEAVSEQLGYPITVASFVHDGTAAATAYAGLSNAAVITIGTALGMGFPPLDQSLCPLSPTFSINYLTA